MVSGKTDEFDYNLIKTMNEVIVSGNLSRAATNLNLSVSAVSSSLKNSDSIFVENSSIVLSMALNRPAQRWR